MKLTMNKTVHGYQVLLIVLVELTTRQTALIPELLQSLRLAPVYFAVFKTFLLVVSSTKATVLCLPDAIPPARSFLLHQHQHPGSMFYRFGIRHS